MTIESSVQNKQKTALGVTQDTGSLEDRINNMVQVMAGGGIQHYNIWHSSL